MKTKKKWSAKVTQTSDALDLKNGVFKLKDPEKIAESLKQSADESHKRKSSPFQSAMSMLNFYENRAGKNLTKTQKAPLEKAKISLESYTANRKNSSIRLIITCKADKQFSQ